MYASLDMYWDIYRNGSKSEKLLGNCKNVSELLFDLKR